MTSHVTLDTVSEVDDADVVSLSDVSRLPPAEHVVL